MVEDLLVDNYSCDWEYYGGLETVVTAIEFGYRNSGMTSYKYSKLSNELFPDKPKGVKLLNYLLGLHHIKFCGGCKTYLFKEDFRLNSTKADGLNTQCMGCHSTASSNTQRSRTARYRAAKLNATVSWGESTLIAEFYLACPTNMVVDHIIPLQGVLVSGLHVLGNLQYLTPEQNSSKRNNFQVL